MEVIMNNENEKLSRNRKKRIARKINMSDDMKLFLNKIKQKTKTKIKILIKLKN